MEKEKEKGPSTKALVKVAKKTNGGLHGRLIPGHIFVQLVPKSLNVFTSRLHSVTTS